MATSAKKPAAKKPAARKSPAKSSSIVEKATGAFKMPVSYKEFVKNPIVATLFLALTGIGYLYIDVKGVFENNATKQEQRVDKLEGKNDTLQVELRNVLIQKAEAGAKSEVVEQMRSLK